MATCKSNVELCAGIKALSIKLAVYHPGDAKIWGGWQDFIFNSQCRHPQQRFHLAQHGHTTVFKPDSTTNL